MEKQSDRQGSIPENPQFWWDEKLYVEHPVIDTFLLYAKASHLLGSVLKFTRKVQAVNNAREAKGGPKTAHFENEIASFKANIPQDMRDPFRPPRGQKGIDPDLLVS